MPSEDVTEDKDEEGREEGLLLAKEVKHQSMVAAREGTPTDSQMLG